MRGLKKCLILAGICLAASCLSAGADTLYSPSLQGAAGDLFDCQVVNTRATAASITLEVFDSDGSLVASKSDNVGPKRVLELAEPFPGGVSKYYCKATVPNSKLVRADAFMLDPVTARITGIVALR